MIAIELVIAAALAGAASSGASPQACVAAGTDARGEPQTSPMLVDFAGAARLDRAALPRGTMGIGCPRASIVPEPNDIRILSELGVSLRIIADDGRSLWIWASDGRLRISIEHGDLNAAESAAVDAWLVAAQARFRSGLALR